MRNNSAKISKNTRSAYEKERALSNDPEKLPIEKWERGTIGKYYRPIKTQVSVRIDNDVLDWLKSKGEDGYLTRINDIIRDKMLEEMKEQRLKALRRRKGSLAS
jgi:uncharacterized protein (DUF4415 family)